MNRVRSYSEEAELRGRQEGREEGRQKGRQEGRKEGRQEGRQEGRLEVALNLLKENMNLDKVCNLTGLPMQKLLQMKKQIFY